MRANIIATEITTLNNNQNKILVLHDVLCDVEQECELLQLITLRKYRTNKCKCKFLRGFTPGYTHAGIQTEMLYAEQILPHFKCSWSCYFFTDYRVYRKI